MPSKPISGCHISNCPNLSVEYSGLCAEHLKSRNQRVDMERGTAAERGYNRRWRDARAFYLAQYPLCVMCQKEGRVTVATVVDHIIPHCGDYTLMWDEGNWQSLCTSCHSKKTALENGGFGKKIKK